MSKQKSKIPNLPTTEEEAKFWDTHDIADFANEFKQVNARFAKNLSEGITIRFDQPTLNKLREIAHNKGIGPTTLTRMWIVENLKHQAYK